MVWKRRAACAPGLRSVGALFAPGQVRLQLLAAGDMQVLVASDSYLLHRRWWPASLSPARSAKDRSDAVPTAASASRRLCRRGLIRNTRRLSPPVPSPIELATAAHRCGSLCELGSSALRSFVRSFVRFRLRSCVADARARGRAAPAERSDSERLPAQAEHSGGGASRDPAAERRGIIEKLNRRMKPPPPNSAQALGPRGVAPGRPRCLCAVAVAGVVVADRGSERRPRVARTSPSLDCSCGLHFLDGGRFDDGTLLGDAMCRPPHIASLLLVDRVVPPLRQHRNIFRLTFLDDHQALLADHVAADPVRLPNPRCEMSLDLELQLRVAGLLRERKRLFHSQRARSMVVARPWLG